MRPIPPMPDRANAGTPPMPDMSARYESLIKRLYAAPAPPHGKMNVKGDTGGAGDTTPPQRTKGAGGVSRAGVDGWLIAPQGSHISRFKFIAEGAEGARLLVHFKGKDNVGETQLFTYYFPDFETGYDIAQQMANSPHPHGEVLFPEVIEAGVPWV